MAVNFLDEILVKLNGTSSSKKYLQLNGGGGSGSVSGQAGVGFRPLNAGSNVHASIEALENGNASYQTNLTFNTNGSNSDSAPSERMRITSAGNVGIGTTAPAVKLHVSGGDIRVDDTERLEFGSGGVRINNDAAGRMYNNAPLGYYWQTTGGYRMVLDSSGRLGVGTTSPGAKLDVLQETRISYAAGNQYRVRITDTDGNGRILVDGQESALIFGTSAATANATATEKMRISSAGNVGIGTTSPDRLLEVYGTTYGYMKIDGGSALSNGFTIGSDSSGFVIYDDDAASYRFVINQSGNVGIGTTAPSQKLTVAGTIMSTASSNPTLILQDTTHSDITIKGDSGIFSVSNASVGQNITMLYNGNVGIGNTAPTTKLEVNGRTQTKGINSIYIGNLTLPVALGWYRVMEWTGSSRGGSVMCLSLTGGNFAPVTYIIKAYKTYGNPAGYNTLKLEQFGGSVYIDKARITYDSGLGKAFVEVYRSSGGSNTMPFQVHQDQLIGYNATSTALVGTAAAGGGQVLEELPFVAEGTAMEKLLISDSIAVGNITNSTTVGRIDAANDVVAFSTSDIRLKDNIKSIDKALDKVNSIQGIEFDWIEKEEVHGNSGHDIGVIAQEVEKVLPDIVTTRDNGYKAVKYEKIVPLLIEAIKDLSKQVDGLKRLI
tara:strand:+ start:451 stop:2433 length:1983 start_codon:yes stop_codon:yes gene_type:complete